VSAERNSVVPTTAIGRILPLSWTDQRSAPVEASIASTSPCMDEL
jgi:hypothetical protein